MKSSMINSALTVLLFLFLIGNIFGQEKSTSYEYLSFKEFLSEKVENDTNFVREIYKNVKYPTAMRTHQSETMVEIILISHPYKNFEIIMVSQPIFFDNLEKQIHTALSKLSIHQEVPFITRFKIAFSLDGLKYSRERYEKFHLGLINNNMFNIQEFIVPEIKHH